jgi:hypothetical protein
MKINYKEVLSTPVDYFSGIGLEWPKRDGEHYRLLTYLAKQFTGITFIDAGTYQGLSCLALAQNVDNTVISYDIEYKNIPFLSAYKNVYLKTLSINDETAAIIKSAHVILLDVDPHDGIQEKVFTDKLNAIGYTGYVLCDDIHLNKPMTDWWNSIEGPKKYDLTKVGHMHGTGLLCYGTDVVITE